VGLFYSIHRRDFSRKCSTNLCQRSVHITWIIREGYIRQKSKIYGNILGNLFSRIKNLSSNVNSIPPIDRWLDRKTKLNIKTIPTILYQLHTKQLVSIITNCIVCI